MHLKENPFKRKMQKALSLLLAMSFALMLIPAIPAKAASTVVNNDYITVSTNTNTNTSGKRILLVRTCLNGSNIPDNNLNFSNNPGQTFVTAKPGYNIASMELDGNTFANGGDIKINDRSTKTLIVNLVPVSKNVTVEYYYDGVKDDAATVTTQHTYGTPVEIIPSPDSGYALSEVTMTTYPSDAQLFKSGKVTFTGVADDLTIKYYYKKPFTVSKTAERINSSLRNEHRITLTATPAAVKQVCPADIVLVIDTSGSMSDYLNTKTKLQLVKEAAKSFVDRVIPDTGFRMSKISVVAFNADSGYWDTPYDDALIKQSFTWDKNAIKNSIDGLYAGGDTNYQAGFMKAEEAFGTANGARAATDVARYVIFFSDGEPNRIYDSQGYTIYSGNAASVAISQALTLRNNTGANIFTVGAVANDAQAMYVLNPTGANKYNVSYTNITSAADFGTAFNNFADEINTAKFSASITDPLGSHMSFIDGSLTGGATKAGNIISYTSNGAAVTSPITISYRVSTDDYYGVAPTNGAARLDYQGIYSSVAGTLQFMSPIVQSNIKANDDSFVTNQNAVFSNNSATSLLANDTSVKSEFSGYTVSSRAVTAGNYNTVLGGTVRILADGTFTYTPPANKVGTDSFQYTVSYNITGGTLAGNYPSTATARIDIVPDAPSVVATIDGTSTPYVNGSWTNKRVKYTLSSTATNGILKYQYSKDGGAHWTDLSSPGFIEGIEGINNHIFRVISTASQNNTSAPTPVYTSKIDTYAPATPAVVLNPAVPGAGGWFSSIPAISITPSAQDTGSPITTYYKLWTGSTEPAETPYTGNPVIPARGQYTLKVYARDEAGNVSDIYTNNIKIDNDIPSLQQTDIVFTKKNTDTFSRFLNYLTFKHFFNGTIEVTITARDSGSGIKEITYYATGEDLNTKIINDVTVQNSAADKSVQIVRFDIPTDFKGFIFAKATDISGLSSSFIQSRGVVVEDNTPEVNIIPASMPNGNGWYKADVNFAVSATDNDSGLNKIKLKIGDGTETTYDFSTEPDPRKTFTIDDKVSASGSIEITATVEDNSGNVTVRKLTVNVDKTQPALATTPAEDMTEYIANKNISVTATDNGGSGMWAVSYQTDEADPQYGLLNPTGGTISLVNNGEYHLTIRATDLAGNESVRTILVKLDDAVPAPPTAVPSVPDNTWTNGSITYTVTGTPTASGINRYEYSFDNGSTWQSVTGGSGPLKNQLTIDAGADSVSNTRVIFRTVSNTNINGLPSVNYTALIDTVKPNILVEDIKFTPKNQGAFYRFLNFITFKHFFNETIEVTITARDLGGGVNNITYYTTGADGTTKVINDVTVTNTASDKSTQVVKFDIPTDFKGYVFAKASDIAGNSMDSFVKSEGVVTEDNTTELSVLSATEPNSEGWNNTNVEISYNASDPDSGLNNVKYKVGNLGEGTIPWTNFGDVIYGSPLYASLTDNGVYDLILTFEDNSGNTKTYTRTIKIDKELPVIVTTPQNDMTDFTSNKTINYTITDNISGIKSISWRTDEATPQSGTLSQNSGDILLKNNGVYNVIITAIDHADNTTTKTIKVMVDSEIPAPPTAVPSVPNGTWTNGNINYKVTGTPTVSGIKRYEYSTDGGNTWLPVTGGSGALKDEFTINAVNGIQVTEVIFRTVSNTDLNSLPSPVYTAKTDTVDPTLLMTDITFKTKNTGAFSRILNFITFHHFFNEEIEVTVTARDVGSGVKDITYYTTGADGTTKVINDVTVTNTASDKSTQVAKFNIPTNFKGFVYAKASDIAGNVMDEFVKSEGVVTENLKPSISISYLTPNSAGWYKNPVPFSITAQDSIAGIYKISYRIGSSPEVTKYYTSGNELLKSAKIENLLADENGSISVNVNAEDNSGNTMTLNYVFNIDMIQPTIATDPADNMTSYTSNNRITVSVSDNQNGSGIKSVTWHTDEGQSGTLDVWGGAIELQHSGSYNLTIDTIDIAGNSATKTLAVKIDKEIPEAPIAVPSIPDNTWTNGSITYKVIGKAPISGINRYECSLDNGATWHLVSGGTGTLKDEVTVPSMANQVYEGKIIFRTVSNTGLKSPASVEYTPRIDTVKPTVTDIAVRKVGTTDFEHIMNFLTFGFFFKEEIEVKITAADVGSGVDSITYYTTGEDGTSVIIPRTAVNGNTATFRIEPAFKGYIFAKATDIAGNSCDFAKSGGVIVENNLPSLSITPASQPNANGWYKNDVGITISAADPDSGIKEIRYTIGSNDEQVVTMPTGKLTYSYTIDNLKAEENGELEVYAVVTDNSGNSTEKSIILKIDTIPPVILTQPENDMTEWTSEKDIPVLITDSTPMIPKSMSVKQIPEFICSGIESAVWTTDEAVPQSGTLQADGDTIALANNGEYNVIITATDRAGNVSTKKLHVMVDNEIPAAPAVTPSVPDKTWTNGSITYTVKGTPTVSGIKRYEYSTDGGSTWLPVTGGNSALKDQVVISAQGGVKIVKLIFRTVSNTDINGRSTSEFTAKIDLTKPEITNIEVALTGDNTFAQIMDATTLNVFFKEKVKARINAFDGGSGVKKIIYKFVPDGANADDVAWITETVQPAENIEDFVLATTQSTDFKGKLYVKAADEVGNVSDIKSGPFCTEDNTPVLTLKPVEDITKWQKSVTLKLAVTDDISGLSVIEYYVDDAKKPEITGFTKGQTEEFKKDILFDTNDIHSIKVKAYDRSGNFTEVSTTVKIDNVKPDIKIDSVKTTDKDYVYSEVPTPGPVTITLSNPNSVKSGVTYYVSSDGKNTWTKLDSNTLTITDTDRKAITYYFKAVSGTELESDPTDALKIFVALTTVEDKETGTVVTGVDGTVFNTDTRLVVRRITTANDKNTFDKDNNIFKSSSFKDGKELIDLYEVKLYRGDNEIQPDGKIQIKLPYLSEFKDRKNPMLLQITANDNSINNLNGKLDNGYFIFETSSLTHFGIAADVKKVLSPNTADTIPGGAATCIVLMLLGVSVILSKRRIKATQD